MLKHPNSNVPFVVGPAYFLGEFDVYDREETLGVRLNRFNPNDESQLRQLLEEFFFKGGRVKNLTSEHKSELLRVLASAIMDDGFDFAALIADDRDPDDCFMLPSSWNIEDPRSFFKNIYSIALENWQSEVEKY